GPISRCAWPASSPPTATRWRARDGWAATATSPTSCCASARIASSSRCPIGAATCRSPHCWHAASAASAWRKAPRRTSASRGGRPFRLIKFRTMRQAERGADGIWQRDNASRVTRFGAVLRRYRLDELPQCVNILKGDMSLVGPRPEMASNVATFSAVIPFYNLRHEVRPGLTGWAQVRAGYSMSTEEVTRKLCYDLYYIKHLSLRFDLWILFDTVKFVLSGKRPG